MKLADFRLNPEVIKRALNLELPYFLDRPRNFEGRSASVLFLLSHSEHEPERVFFLMTKRPLTLESHPGEMAFPGGMKDPRDLSVFDTALRETFEEVGIEPHQIEILGELPNLFTLSSRIGITPIVARLRGPHESLVLIPNVEEIQFAQWIPLLALLEPGVYRDESFLFQGNPLNSPVFEIAGEKIWGATGLMIKNFLDRIQSL